jgi:hypothetical protein
MPAQQRAGRDNPMQTQAFRLHPDNAASTARSVHSSRGFAFARCSTATSCRSTGISVSFDADDLANSTSQENTATANR